MKVINKELIKKLLLLAKDMGVLEGLSKDNYFISDNTSYNKAEEEILSKYEEGVDYIKKGVYYCEVCDKLWFSPGCKLGDFTNARYNLLGKRFCKEHE